MQPRTRQFLALPFALIGIFVVSAVAASMIPSPFSSWLEPFVGPVCASIQIIAAFGMAPSRPRTVGAVTLVVGGLVAWWLLHNAYFPEFHPRAYQRTLMPFYATLTAGVLTYFACWAFWRPSAKSSV